MSSDEKTQRELFYVNQYFIKFLRTLKFMVSDKISTFMIELYEPLFQTVKNFAVLLQLVDLSKTRS